MSDLVGQGVGMTTRTLSRNGPPPIDEIDGYIELGMQEEALAQVHVTLNRNFITPEEFNSCVFALLQTDQPESWKRTVENAHSRLKTPGDDKVRSAMLNYYFTIGESKVAWKFFPRHWTKFFDAWVMMQVSLELGRLNQAKAVAQTCSDILAAAQDDFTKSSMIDALTSYHVRLCNWDVALKLWEEAPDEPCFQRQRLTGIVKIHLARALEAAKDGLTKVAADRIDLEIGNEVPLPGNRAEVLDQTERELKELEGAIDKIMDCGALGAKG